MASAGQSSSKKAHLPVAVRYNPDARVRTTTYRKKPLYTILYGYDANDKQQVISRRDKADATEIAKKAVLAARAQSEGRDAASVTTSKEAFDYAASELAPYNVGIVEVVAWWKKWHDSIKHYVSVTEAVDLWVEEHHFKTGKTNKREAYWRGMKDTYLNPFKRTFPDRQMTTLTKEDFEHYLFEVKTGVSHAQKKEHTNKLRTWLGWCITKGFFSNQTKPLDGIKYGKDAPKKGADERIVSVEVLRSALDFCALGQTPRDLNIGIILAIRVFVGFRARETYTLRFRAIKDRNKDIIRITSNDEPKTFARNPDLQPATIDWLNHFMDRFPKGQKPKDDDWLMPKATRHGIILNECISMSGFRQHLGHKTKSSWGSRWEAWAKENNRPFQRLGQNRLRDTFASCGLIALGQERTLLGMGENNPATLKKWYYNAVDSGGAKAHFEFRPDDKQRADAAKKKAEEEKSAHENLIKEIMQEAKFDRELAERVANGETVAGVQLDFDNEITFTQEYED
jgi:integrase